MKKLLTALTLLSTSFLSQAEWVYIENVDLMTDENKSIIATTNGRHKMLALRCEKDSPKGYHVILSFDYLGESNDVYVRFDKDKPFKVNGSESTRGNAIFINSDSYKKLLNGFKAKSKVAFQTTDFRGTTKQAAFDLNGFSKELSKVNCVK